MIKSEPGPQAPSKFSKRRAVGGASEPAETDTVSPEDTQDNNGPDGGQAQRTDWWADGNGSNESSSATQTATLPPPPAAASASSIHSNIAQRIQQQQNSGPAPVFAVPQHPIHPSQHQNLPAPASYHSVDFNDLLPTRPDLRPRVLNENQKRAAELSDSFEQYLRLMDVPSDPNNPNQLSVSGIERMFALDASNLMYNPMTGGVHAFPQAQLVRPNELGGTFQPLPEMTAQQLRSLLPGSISLSDLPYENNSAEHAHAEGSSTSPRDPNAASPGPNQMSPHRPPPKANLMLADINQRLQQQVDNTPVPQPIGSPHTPQQLAQLQTAQMLLARHAIMQQQMQQQMAQAAQLQQAHQQQQRQPQQMQAQVAQLPPHLQLVLQQQAHQQAQQQAQQAAQQLQLLQQTNSSLGRLLPSPTPMLQPAPQLSMAMRTPAPAPGVPGEHPRLIIDEQPTPKSLWKKRRIVPPFQVRLVPGITGIKMRGLVQAYLVTDSPEKIELTGSQEETNNDGVAVFEKLQFSKGSHQHLVQIYFEMQVTTGDDKILTVTTPSSEPFIICTNINQWIASEKKIFKKICFGEESQVAWELFRHHVQAHFPRALGCARGLSAQDLEYVHARVGNRLQITQHAFNEFWDWYGPILKEIYEKTGHWRSIWERNMIYGFLARTTAEHLLTGQPEGTFVISFAETRPGLLGVYHVLQGVSCEYLMSPEEQRASFREFLVNAKTLQALLCPSPDGTSKPEVVSKAKLLREFRPPRVPKTGTPASSGVPEED